MDSYNAAAKAAKTMAPTKLAPCSRAAAFPSSFSSASSSFSLSSAEEKLPVVSSAQSPATTPATSWNRVSHTSDRYAEEELTSDLLEIAARVNHARGDLSSDLLHLRTLALNIADLAAELLRAGGDALERAFRELGDQIGEFGCHDTAR